MKAIIDDSVTSGPLPSWQTPSGASQPLLCASHALWRDTCTCPPRYDTAPQSKGAYSPFASAALPILSPAQPWTPSIAAAQGDRPQSARSPSSLGACLWDCSARRINQRDDIVVRKGARALLLDARAGKAPAGHPYHNIGVGSCAICGRGEDRSETEVDQPRPPTRSPEHQGADDRVVGRTNRLKALRVIPLHKEPAIEADRIPDLRYLGEPSRGKAETIPAVSIPARGRARVGTER